ncbi:MAG: hypothetical protein Q9O24_06315 [Gammaproteobacteria bacterium]|nr:hypothetical protein [Gammaproteobacteria bacterium]
MRSSNPLSFISKRALSLLLLSSLVLLAACSPKYAIKDLYPDNAKNCLYKAKQVNLRCRTEHKSQVDVCKINHSQLYQEQLNHYNHALLDATEAYTNCDHHCAEFQHQETQLSYFLQQNCAINNGTFSCSRQFKRKQHEYQQAKKAYLHCSHGCQLHQNNIDQINQQKPVSKEAACNDYYAACVAEFDKNSTQCGRYKISYCQENCDKADYLVKCIEGDCPTEVLKKWQHRIEKKR